MTAEDLAYGCRLQSGRRLALLAQRMEPRPGLNFDDLVLAPPNLRQLNDLRARIALRSQLADSGFERRLPLASGLLAMFTGSSGTGKTMAAELLAQEQRVDLYKIDLAEVVSKYIGETEKNLRRVFREAEDTNAMIFFDEADALFGKRGEVREAKDRWANIEVNFLLQRVEQFAGIVIIATNLRQNIDEAFLRRIHVVVEFPFPDADARLRIWQRMLPSSDEVEAPNGEELRDLAERFRLPGGSIRNVVVDARLSGPRRWGRSTPDHAPAYRRVTRARVPESRQTPDRWRVRCGDVPMGRGGRADERSCWGIAMPATKTKAEPEKRPERTKAPQVLNSPPGPAPGLHTGPSAGRARSCPRPTGSRLRSVRPTSSRQIWAHPHGPPV